MHIILLKINTTEEVLKSAFTKIILIVFLSLIFASFALPQHNHNDKRYDNKNTPMISDKTDKLLDKIKEKLDDLDNSYLRKLHHREYNEAKKELNNIYRLIEEVKNQIYAEENPPIAAMNNVDYKRLVESISNESFEENKIQVLQASAKYNYFSVEQIIGLMDLSTFSSWKLKALELTYPFVVDKYNSYKILNALSFSEDKKKAQEILDRN